jgi:hypothetical protein
LQVINVTNYPAGVNAIKSFIADEDELELLLQGNKPVYYASDT